MKTTFKLILLTGFIFGNVAVYAQSQLTTPFLNSGNGQFNASGAKEYYLDIKGQPYLFADWSKGSIKTDYAQTDNVNMLYNEVDDRLIFKVAKSDVRKVALPVKEISITDVENGNAIRKFKAGFARTKFSNDKTFFEVLIDGKTKLLKKNIKNISENREYSGKIARTVVSDTNYYLVFDDNKPVEIKLNQKSANKLLANVSGFIQSNQLNLKRQDDLIKLVNYYNTL